MSTHEDSFKWLAELGNPAERRTRIEVIERAFRAALLLTSADAVVVLAPHGRSSERLAFHAGSDVPARLQGSRQPSEVAQRITESSLPVAYPDLSEFPSAVGDACPGVEAGPALFIPIRQRNQEPAYLAVYRKRGRAPFSANETRVLQLLGAWLGVSLEGLRIAIGTERLAVKDELTEVYNHRFLKSAVQREVRRAARFRHELSVVLIAVEGLAEYEQENGELRGSVLLKELSTVLAQQVRSFDVMGRYGDDEFLMILPETGLDGAVEVAERVRGVVEASAFSNAPPATITVSLGVASFPAAGAKAELVITAAERALEQARRQGRNRVGTIDRAA